MTREKAEEAEDDVDEQVSAAASDDEHTERWDCRGLLEKM